MAIYLVTIDCTSGCPRKKRLIYPKGTVLKGDPANAVIVKWIAKGKVVLAPEGAILTTQDEIRKARLNY